MIKNKKFKRSISLITLVSSVFCQVLVSFAGVPKVNVDGKWDSFLNFSF